MCRQTDPERRRTGRGWGSRGQVGWVAGACKQANSQMDCLRLTEPRLVLCPLPPLDLLNLHLPPALWPPCATSLLELGELVVVALEVDVLDQRVQVRQRVRGEGRFGKRVVEEEGAFDCMRSHRETTDGQRGEEGGWMSSGNDGHSQTGQISGLTLLSVDALLVVLLLGQLRLAQYDSVELAGWRGAEASVDGGQLEFLSSRSRARA